MKEHIWFCWALNMCHCIITDVNVSTGLLCYYRPWYQQTRTCQRSSRWNQRHWQTVSFLININSEISGSKRVWNTDGYAHWNPCIWCYFGQIISKHLYDAERKHEVIYKGKYKKGQVNGSGKKWNIMFRMMLMLRKNMWGCFVIQTSFHHCHFVVHTQNHMV